MVWQFSEDVEAYLRAAGALLRSDPVEHTLPLTVAEAARLGRGPVPSFYGWWSEEPDAAGAVSWSAPFGLLLAAVPDPAVRPLVDALLAHPAPPSLVDGPCALTAQLGVVWAARTGAAPQLRRAERLHRLGELQPPVPHPPGKARLAESADAPLLEAWLTAFATEAGVPAGNVPALVADRLSHAGLLLWEQAGQPVSLAAANRPVAGVARIGPVYTPPEHRGRGYAAAVTATASSRARQAGTPDVVLFTDLANPTSNALYQRLGFHPLSDRLVLDLPDPC